MTKLLRNPLLPPKRKKVKERLQRQAIKVLLPTPTSKLTSLNKRQLRNSFQRNNKRSKPSNKNKQKKMQRSSRQPQKWSKRTQRLYRPANRHWLTSRNKVVSKGSNKNKRVNRNSKM